MVICKLMRDFTIRLFTSSLAMGCF